MEPTPEPVASVPLLNTEEIRVLGCLMEKNLGTPEYYPLTLNALVAACNQKNNRDPVVSYDETTVARTLEGLRDRRLAALVTTAGGRAPKYKHLLSETLGLDEKDTALLCELMLRGPQTPGELRSRAGRLAPFEGTAAVQVALDGLAVRPAGALVARLPRQPGQKEARFAHLLSGPLSAADAAAPEPAAPPPGAEQERVARLEAVVAALRADLDALKNLVEKLGKPAE